MKALFAHDHRFIPDAGEVYSESEFSSQLWSRYLAVFDELVVIGREAQIPAHKSKADLEKSSASNVEFSLIPNLSSLKGQTLRGRQSSRIIKNRVENSDIVISRLPSEIGLSAVAQARRQRKPYAIEVVGCAWDALWNYGGVKGKAYAYLQMLRMRRAIAVAPFAIYVTKEFLQNRYPNHGGVAETCSNVRIPEPRSANLVSRLQDIDRPKTPLIFGLIGSLRTRYKGIQTVFEALEVARRDLPAVQFRILGSGDREPWRKLARRHGVADIVRFDGTLPSGEAVYGWLDDVDVYLQPSLQEGLPRSLIEAMSRALPCLASSCAGIPELLDRQCLIRPGDSKSLAGILLAAVYDKGWKKQQATQNWQTAKNYSTHILDKRRTTFWETVAEQAVSYNR